MLKDEDSIQELSKVFQKTKHIKNHVREIIPFLHQDYCFFVFEFSEIRTTNKLRCYVNNTLVESSTWKVNPLFSCYLYSFNIIENTYSISVVASKVREMSSKGENKTIENWDITNWVTGEEITERTSLALAKDSDLFENFNKPVFEMKNNITGEQDANIFFKTKVSNLKRYLSVAEKRFVEDDNIKQISDEMKTVLVLNYVIRDAEFISQIFEDISTK